MHSNKNPKQAIIRILKEHPEGLTYTSLADITGMHRHTVTKYVYELMGAEKIQQREIGSAKLCFLRDDIKTQKNNFVDNVLGRKAEIGQTQMLAVFLFMVLIPGMIIAQNMTNISHTGAAIQTSLTINESNQNETIQKLLTELNESLEYENNTSAELEDNDSLIIEIPLILDNDTELNETIPLPDFNESNETFDDANETDGVSEVFENETIVVEIPEEIIEIPELKVDISYPGKVTRNNELTITATVFNEGNVTVKDLKFSWNLPEGFDIIAEEISGECTTLNPFSECSSEVILQTSLGTELGKKDIGVVVSYEE